MTTDVVIDSDGASNDLYALSAVAWATQDRLTVTVQVDCAFDPAHDPADPGREHPLRPDPLLLLVDGRDCLWSGWWNEHPPYGGHSLTRTQVGNRVTYEARVNLDLFEPGRGARELTVRLENSAGGVIVGYLRIPLDVPEPAVPRFGPAAPLILAADRVQARGIDSDPDAADLDKFLTHYVAGAFVNPEDRGWSYDQWYLSCIVEAVRPAIDVARRRGKRLLLRGDDLFGTVKEKQWAQSSPFAQEAWRVAAIEWAASGLVDFMIAQDEMGGTPDDDGAVYRRFAAAWRDAGGPPFAWGNHGLGPNAWETPDVSDGAYRQYDPGMVSPRTGLPSQWTASQCAAVVARAGAGVPAGRPWATQAGCVGPTYLKRVQGGDYQAGSDDLKFLPLARGSTIVNVWAALAAPPPTTHPPCGILTYLYDSPEERGNRLRAPLGAELGTGFRVGDDHGRELAAAYGAALRHAAELVGPWRPGVWMGPALYGYRAGLEWVVNTSDRAVRLDTTGCELVLPPGVTESPGRLPGGSVAIRTV